MSVISGSWFFIFFKPELMTKWSKEKHFRIVTLNDDEIIVSKTDHCTKQIYHCLLITRNVDLAESNFIKSNFWFVDYFDYVNVIICTIPAQNQTAQTVTVCTRKLNWVLISYNVWLGLSIEHQNAGHQHRRVKVHKASLKLKSKNHMLVI